MPAIPAHRPRDLAVVGQRQRKARAAAEARTDVLNVPHGVAQHANPAVAAEASPQCRVLVPAAGPLHDHRSNLSTPDCLAKPKRRHARLKLAVLIQPPPLARVRDGAANNGGGFGSARLVPHRTIRVKPILMPRSHGGGEAVAMIAAVIDDKVLESELAPHAVVRDVLGALHVLWGELVGMRQQSPHRRVRMAAGHAIATPSRRVRRLQR